MQYSIGKKVLSYIKIKALITILGTAGYDVKHMQLRNSMPEYIEGDVSVGNFRNLFPFLYEKLISVSIFDSILVLYYITLVISNNLFCNFLGNINKN